MEWLRHLYQYLISLDIQRIHSVFEHYSAFGPLPGIFLPLLESLFPPLPLFVIVATNAIAYGFWLGTLYSLIGCICGSLIVFLISRKFQHRFRHYMEEKHPKSKRFFAWVQDKSFTPLFILASLPIVPSFFINIGCGVSNVRLHTFLLSIGMGKLIMVTMMAYVGHDWQSFLVHPWKILILLAVFLGLWYVGKRVEKHYQLG